MSEISTLGKQIQHYRGKRSQQWLSDKTKIPRPRISEIETGKRQELSISNIIKLAEALDVSIDDLLRPEGYQKPKRKAKR